MSAFSIKFNEEQLQDVQSLYDALGKNANVCVVRVINKTMVGTTDAGGTIKDIKQVVLSEVNLLSRFFDQGYFGRSNSSKGTLDYTKADLQTLKGVITVSGANIPLIHYSNQRGERSYTPKKITVQVLKSRSPVTLRHAFIPKLRSGYRGLFETVLPKVKTAGGRYKIQEMYGPRIPDLFIRTEIYENKVEPAIKTRLDDNLNDEMDKYLDECNGIKKRFK